MKTNLENYEERFVDYMEGQLDAAEMQEVEAFVAQHPELEEDFRLFCNSKLKPDNTIVFTKKDRLMRPKAVIVPMYKRVAAIAAAVVVLIGIGFLFFNHDQSLLLDKASLISGLTPKKSALAHVEKAPALPKQPTVSDPIVESASPTTKPASMPKNEPMMLAQVELTPTLKPIKTNAIQSQDSFDEYLEDRLDMDLNQYLATLSPIYDTEVLEDYDDEDEAHFPKIASTIYKRTAKTLLAAYYTADCYINEARRNVLR